MRRAKRACGDDRYPEDKDMRTLRELLAHKGHQIYSIAPDASVFDALTLMAEKDIGAVLVLGAGGELAGILSERDYARKVVLRGQTSRDTPVSAIMTERVYCGNADQTIEECLAVMTAKRIRHMPVTDRGRLLGMVSIGDIGKAMISAQGFVIEQLENYICGTR
jgi:CBS domain-containing protein